MTVESLGRVVAAYRRTASSRSAMLLIAANLIPLVGVLFYGWSLWTILVLYWVENGIVGFWNVPKLLLAQGSIIPTLPPLPDDAARAATGGDLAAAADLQAAWSRARAAQAQAQAAPASATAPAAPPRSRVRVFGQPAGGSAGRIGLAIFFVMHYGIFWFVHGVFVFALPAFFGGEAAFGCNSQLVPGGTPGGYPGPVELGSGIVCSSAFGDIAWSNVVIGAVALLISHGASFLFNYIGRGEYLTMSPARQMGVPYGRVVVLHLTILLGAFAITFLGAPIAALLLLVGLKTAFDLTLHLRERRNAGARVRPGTAYAHIHAR